MTRDANVLARHIGECLKHRPALTEVLSLNFTIAEWHNLQAAVAERNSEQVKNAALRVAATPTSRNNPAYQKEPGGDWYIHNGDGSEHRLLDLAPNLEREALKDREHVGARGAAAPPNAMREALELARKRIEYFGEITDQRHREANEQYFLPPIDAALCSVSHPNQRVPE